ncbi:hypothetical protein LOD99_12374 [Oopsacas minuta]|uniref:Transmembrane protein n=1 Tax=Oopsacas minuta TaxID=111878 RepID=A0AAV7JFH8_9METZ|nr:hypothetical protein LOD99_12374 [Oopsacas minuta]
MFLSSLELNEQKYIQATFAILRYIAFLSITIFSIYIIIYNVYNPSNPIPSQLQRENSNTVNLLLRFDIQKWLVTLPVIAYALNLNHGISPLSHPIAPKNHLKPMYIMVFISLWLAYAIVGLTVSVAFLHLVNENASLNWAYFVSFPNSIFVRTISYFILLFPSLDVLSIYALLVTTISNNIYLVVMCRDTSQGSFTRLDRFGKLLFRLIIAFIPLIGSLFVSNLVALLKIAGLIALILQFLIPCASQIQSKRLCRIELEKFRNESSLTVTNKSSHIIETDSEIQNITHKQKAITGKIGEFLFNVEARTSFSGWYSNNITIIFVSIVGALSFCCASLNIVYS